MSPLHGVPVHVDNNFSFAGAVTDQLIVTNNGDAAKNKKLYDPSGNK